MDQPKYHIDIFWSDEDGGYVANVPDLRYCSAFGETYEEALREVLVAMELHLELLRETGRPVPRPGSRRGVGVSALVLESGQTVGLQEEMIGEVIGSVESAGTTAAGEMVVGSHEASEEGVVEAVVEVQGAAEEAVVEIRVRKNVLRGEEVVEDEDTAERRRSR